MTALPTSFIQVMKARLDDERRNLEHQLKGIARRDPHVKGDYDAKFEDVGSDMDANQGEIAAFTDALGVENVLELKLQEVTAALARIAQGTYGICEETGKAIPRERLEVNPAARVCVEVEEQRRRNTAAG